jgi:hypothetical protein
MLERDARTGTLKTYDCPTLIKQKTEGLRRDWHRLRTPESKRLLNTATQELKQLLSNNINPNIPARAYNNRIHWLFPVEGNQEDKTGQETFSITKEITRNLSKKHTLSLNT